MKRLIRTSTYIRPSKEIDFGEGCPFKRTTDTSYYDNFPQGFDDRSVLLDIPTNKIKYYSLSFSNANENDYYYI